jgi:hypothetical protein
MINNNSNDKIAAGDDDDMCLPCSKSFIFDKSSRALQATIYS